MSVEEWNIVDTRFQVNNQSNPDFTELVKEMDKTIESLNNDDKKKSSSDEKKEWNLDFTSPQIKMDKNVVTSLQQTKSRFVIKYLLTVFFIVSLLTVLKTLLESWIDSVVQKSMIEIVDQHHTMNQTLANVVEQNRKLSLEIRNNSVNVNPTNLLANFTPMINRAEKRIGDFLAPIVSTAENKLGEFVSSVSEYPIFSRHEKQLEDFFSQNFTAMMNTTEKRIGDFLAPIVSTAENKLGEFVSSVSVFSRHDKKVEDFLAVLTPIVSTAENKVGEFVSSVSKYPIFSRHEKELEDFFTAMMNTTEKRIGDFLAVLTPIVSTAENKVGELFCNVTSNNQ